MRLRGAAPPGIFLTLRIESLDGEGRGVAHSPAGKVVFVEGALPEEIVVGELLQTRKSFDLAQTVEILHASSARRAPRCPNFGVCGGCGTQHAETRTQVAAKQRGLEENLARIGRVEAETMLAPIYGEEWGYRHRARLTVRHVAKKGGVLVGFHERRSSYVTDMRECAVLPEAVSALIPALRELIASFSLHDRMPQIEIALGDAEPALVFRNLLPLTRDDEALLRAFAQQHRIVAWLQPEGPDSARPFHPPDAPLPAYLLPEFDLRMEFRPTDFTQVNHGVNRMLVRRAMRLLDPRAGERIGDLFCGLGNFSFPIARLGARVTGIEGEAGLVARAQANAAANGLAGHAHFVRADLFRLEAETLATYGPFEKLLIDPPRQGAAGLIAALPAEWPQRIVYVSCDVATLARDAGALVHEKGFRLLTAGVVNMFPHTAHVESIALFERDPARAGSR